MARSHDRPVYVLHSDDEGEHSTIRCGDEVIRIGGADVVGGYDYRPVRGDGAGSDALEAPPELRNQVVDVPGDGKLWWKG